MQSKPYFIYFQIKQAKKINGILLFKHDKMNIFSKIECNSKFFTNFVPKSTL